MRHTRAFKRILSVVLSLTLLSTLAIPALADADNRPFLSLGKEQNDQERQTVLQLLGVDPNKLDEYNVLYVSNQDERDYLGKYMSMDLIGTRALSSVLITKAKDGTGIQVECQNINYCTPGMYRNALITAGVTDAVVKVAAPFQLPGTAALVGAMKSYEAITGKPLEDKSKDAATNELIVTGEVGENIGDQKKAEELMALVKQEVVDNKAKDDKEIGKAVDKSAEALEVKLSDADRQLIIDLMKKISDLDLNIDNLKTQAKDLYDKLADIKIDDGFFASIGNFFSNLWNSIVEFFSNLFGGGNKDASSEVSSEASSSEASSEVSSSSSSADKSSAPASSAPSSKPDASSSKASSSSKPASSAPASSQPDDGDDAGESSAASESSAAA